MIRVKHRTDGGGGVRSCIEERSSQETCPLYPLVFVSWTHATQFASIKDMKGGGGELLLPQGKARLELVSKMLVNSLTVPAAKSWIKNGYLFFPP